MANNLDALLARAKSLRQDILKMTTEAGSGHPSSSLSAVEIVTALYFGGFLRHDPKNPHWADRDRFILSKGHAAPVLYAALAQAENAVGKQCDGEAGALVGARRLTGPADGMTAHLAAGRGQRCLAIASAQLVVGVAVGEARAGALARQLDLRLARHG